MTEIADTVLALAQSGRNPAQIAGDLRISIRRVVDMLKAAEYPVEHSNQLDAAIAHELAECRHRVEDHQLKIRQKDDILDLLNGDD